MGGCGILEHKVWSLLLDSHRGPPCGIFPHKRMACMGAWGAGGRESLGPGGDPWDGCGIFNTKFDLYCSTATGATLWIFPHLRMAFMGAWGEAWGRVSLG